MFSRSENERESSEVMEDYKLLSVQVVFRHGDRTAMKSYANDPHKDVNFKECDPGELTNQGKQQQYELGKWIRNRYKEFLPRKYSPKDVLAISNDVDRCVMSASCQLCGLYPPLEDEIWNENIKWQPIPVHINAVLMDPIPKFEHIGGVQEVRDFFKEGTERHQDVLKHLTQHSGEVVPNLWLALRFRDILSIQALQNLPLPEWTQKIYPGPLEQMVAEVFFIGVKVPQMGKFAVGPILKTITDNFECPTRKLTIYSGHDYTISTLIGILAPEYPIFVPEFSSTVLFELYEKDGCKYINVLMKRGEKLEPILNMQKFEEFKLLVEPWSISLDEKQNMFKAGSAANESPTNGSVVNDLSIQLERSNFI